MHYATDSTKGTVRNTAYSTKPFCKQRHGTVLRLSYNVELKRSEHFKTVFLLPHGAMVYLVFLKGKLLLRVVCFIFCKE